ncbi:hypothetical protein N336_11372, partial [Phalacrocorax carbo]
GSLGLDLATAIDVTLIDTRPRKIRTGIKGPLIIDGQACGALLFGRASRLQGLFVLPGVIDCDYEGEICIVAQTAFPPICIPKGSKLAQLVPIQQLARPLVSGDTSARGTGGFGSTGGLALLTPSLNERPLVSVVITHRNESQRLSALLDTGADITIVA